MLQVLLSYSAQLQYAVFTANGIANQGEDISFDALNLHYYSGTDRSDVKYVGVALYAVSWNGGKACESEYLNSISYPAYIDVNSITWVDY